jgi:hypothetical protein
MPGRQLGLEPRSWLFRLQMPVRGSMELQASGFEFFQILEETDWKNYATASQKSHRTTVKRHEMTEQEIFLPYQSDIARE